MFQDIPTLTAQVPVSWEILGKIVPDPIVSKFNGWHIEIFQFPFIILRFIP